MENKKKSRKFIYEIEKIPENIDEKIEDIKNMDFKYHIIGSNNDSNGKYTKITGFICFQNPRYDTSVRKLLGLENIKYTEEDSYLIHKEISEMHTFWEKGTIPKQSHKIKNTKTNTTVDTTDTVKYIMNQNQQLLEYAFNEKQKLLEQENMYRQKEQILLYEQNKQLLEENNRLKQNMNQNTVSFVNHSNENSNNTNSNNKTFNVNMFLNNECKDAITLMDFVKNIQIENEDIFYAKEHGFAEAMIRVLENGLKNYDIKERPLHCTDTKRETMHIKNESGWHKEIGSQSEDISKAIKSLSRKKMDKVSNYINNEGKSEFASKKFEENLNMMREVSNGVAYPEQHIKKIVKNLVNNVKLEKG